MEHDDFFDNPAPRPNWSYKLKQKLPSVGKVAKWLVTAIVIVVIILVLLNIAKARTSVFQNVAMYQTLTPEEKSDIKASIPPNMRLRTALGYKVIAAVSIQDLTLCIQDLTLCKEEQRMENILLEDDIRKLRIQLLRKNTTTPVEPKVNIEPTKVNVEGLV